MKRSDASSCNTPFSTLTPERVIDIIESLGFTSDGRIIALNSYENRVFRIGLEDNTPIVAKFYRPNRWSDNAILEEHAFARALRDAELSVVAPLTIHQHTLHHVDETRVAVFPLQGGHAPEPAHRTTLTAIGKALAQLHNIGASQRFVHRPTLSVARFGEEPLRWLLDSHWLDSDLRRNAATIGHALLNAIQQRFEQVGTLPHLRLHGDCHLGNILWRDNQPHFVDLDDSLTGPAIQDLWMLIAGSHDEQREQIEWLLEGYEIFRPFDRSELHLIEALRGLRLLHYHAWVAKRWDDPAFPAAFSWFAQRRHWETFLTQMQEQLAEIQNH